MKFSLISDIHLEFRKELPFPTFEHSGGVLILAGDIYNARLFNRGISSPYTPLNERVIDQFEKWSNEFECVIYVLGNHEYYGGYVEETVSILKDKTNHIDNFHVLSNEYLDISNIRIVGSTLWTDANSGNPLTDMYMKSAMTDFGGTIKWKSSHSKFTPLDSRHLHNEALNFIDSTQNGIENVLVVSHHAPSELSIDDRFKGDALNPAYFSNLENFILDRPNIKTWVHGHMHNYKNYFIGDTRVICNPWGYPGEFSGYRDLTFMIGE